MMNQETKLKLEQENLRDSEIQNAQIFTLNMGPQHPSTHGVYRAILTIQGEYIIKAENVIGYLHRGIEKLAEDRTYTQVIPYTDRVDYLAGFMNNWGYAMAVEKLMGVEVPERAEYIRVIVGELQRIASHLLMLGSFSLDVSGFSGWMYVFADREKVLDLLEMVTGARMTLNYARIGGVAQDLPECFLPKLREFIKYLPDRIRLFDELVTGNEIFISRTKGTGIIDKETCLDYCMTGGTLRAAGIPFDLRKNAPYSVYDRFKFDIPTQDKGDSFDRYMIRIEEMWQSLSILEQAIESLPEGPVKAKIPKVIKPPVGEAYAHMESARGNLGFYVVSDGSVKPYRVHIHGPSFVNIGVLPKIAEGMTIQDFVVFLASLDFVLGEVDR